MFACDLRTLPKRLDPLQMRQFRIGSYFPLKFMIGQQGLLQFECFGSIGLPIIVTGSKADFEAIMLCSKIVHGRQVAKQIQVTCEQPAASIFRNKQFSINRLNQGPYIWLTASPSILGVILAQTFGE